MLFRERTTELEYFDDPSRTRDELRTAFRQLSRVNGLFRLHDPYTRIMSAWLGPEYCRDLSILDVGAGDGWLGEAVSRWAAQQGWSWRVTNLDLNTDALALSRGGMNIAGSALALPFQDGAFDVVIASQMTHHFNSDDDVTQHFREAWRVADRAVFLTDMQRNAFLYCVLWLVLPLLRITGTMRDDGLLSVKKSWRVREWRELARRAGLPDASVSGYYATRVILAALKRHAPALAGAESRQYGAADALLARSPE
jgi:ubiquinone/menaquinone biosynthesis C-methylase UbiE